MDEAERERLVSALQEFDPSDDYHAQSYEEPGYYAAIARAVRLVRGEIATWTDPPA